MNTSLIRSGSQPFTYNVGAILAGATVWVDVNHSIPAAREFEPLDQMVLQNNSGQAITLTVDSPSITYSIQPYTIQPVNRAFRRFAITNDGSGNISSGQVVVTVKRKPE